VSREDPNAPADCPHADRIAQRAIHCRRGIFSFVRSQEISPSHPLSPAQCCHRRQQRSRDFVAADTSHACLGSGGISRADMEARRREAARRQMPHSIAISDIAIWPIVRCVCFACRPRHVASGPPVAMDSRAVDYRGGRRRWLYWVCEPGSIADANARRLSDMSPGAQNVCLGQSRQHALEGFAEVDAFGFRDFG
jgi:hypothetical protein